MTSARRKGMESPLISGYPFLVRRLFRSTAALVAALFVSLGAIASGALHPHFIVLRENSDFVKASRALELAGVRLRQRVPPRIVVADVPDGVSVGALAPVDSDRTSVVPLSSLDAFGPAAIAAGTNWNRQFLSGSAAGASSLSAMRVLVSQGSLPAPAHLTVTSQSDRLDMRWDPVDGSLYYVLDVGSDPEFNDVAMRSRTATPAATLPIPATDAGGVLYVRVRGVDHAPGEHQPQDDIYGTWTKTGPISFPALAPAMNATAPTPTSPVDGFKTAGTTLAFEWMGQAGTYWLEASRDAGFTDLFTDTIVDGNEFVVQPATLHVGDVLYWRVRRWGTSGSDWSAVRRASVGPVTHRENDSFINPEAPR